MSKLEAVNQFCLLISTEGGLGWTPPRRPRCQFPKMVNGDVVTQHCLGVTQHCHSMCEAENRGWGESGEKKGSI